MALEEGLLQLAVDDSSLAEVDARLEAVTVLISAMSDDIAALKMVQRAMTELELADIPPRATTDGAIPVHPTSGLRARALRGPGQLFEPSRVRGSAGLFGSTTVRVSRDVSLRLGGYGGESSPSESRCTAPIVER